MRNRKVRFLAVCVLGMVILAAASAWGAFSVSGRWLLEGTGYAEKGSLRVSLEDVGYADITGTQQPDGTETITGYTIHVTLDASLLGINAWSYDDTVVFATPVQLPELDPTVNNPFTFPAVTVDRITYQATLTSATSGTVKIYGTLDVDGVGDVDITSESAIWKEGTPKPSIPDNSSGCNAAGFMPLALLVAAGVVRINLKNIKKK